MEFMLIVTIGLSMICQCFSMDGFQLNQKRPTTITKSLTIVNGDVVPADSSDYYYMVTLARLNEDGSLTVFCGGAILRPDVVITAYHCFKGEVLSKVFIRPNYDNTINDIPLELYYGISNISTHEEANVHDICLVLLDTPIEFSDRIKSISLPSEEVGDGTSVYVMGFGRMWTDGPISIQLRTARLTKQPDFLCSQFWPKSFHDDRHFCTAGPMGEDSCKGDSGGPLVQMEGSKVVIVGIVSFGADCGSDYGVNMKVFAYVDWIRTLLESKSRLC
ncbi:venom peptide isomerase heavy chain-like [Panonychus citri]|uniref:venom peptide isomerase heavy chain-like n=1 Tax=Panonychus citri TaxID=50023 RepID=UPI0023077CE6|nr:venom peptide isomerase heavy chain-like [Panonychus citri]